MSQSHIAHEVTPLGLVAVPRPDGSFRTIDQAIAAARRLSRPVIAAQVAENDKRAKQASRDRAEASRAAGTFDSLSRLAKAASEAL